MRVDGPSGFPFATMRDISARRLAPANHQKPIPRTYPIDAISGRIGALQAAVPRRRELATAPQLSFIAPRMNLYFRLLALMFPAR